MKSVDAELAIRVALATEVRATLTQRRKIQTCYEIELFWTQEDHDLMCDLCDKIIHYGQVTKQMVNAVSIVIDLRPSIAVLGQIFRLTHAEIDKVVDSILGDCKNL